MYFLKSEAPPLIVSNVVEVFKSVDKDLQRGTSDSVLNAWHKEGRFVLEVEAGRGDLNIDRGTSMSSGTYFYQVTVWVLRM